MGVSGCGKSTVARACAERLGWAMVEGDDHHAPESVAKMHAGTPLTDADRVDWLRRLAGILERHCVLTHGREGARGPGSPGGRGAGAGPGLFLTCSALRRSYRELLRASCPGLGFVFLELEEGEALRRTGDRPGHFFPSILVRSQFATLESPRGEAGVLAVDATLPVGDIAGRVVGWLGAPGADAAAC
ncbi:MAG: gluconokinase [Xylophilus ampelinus]